MIEKDSKIKIYILDTCSILENTNSMKQLGKGGNIVILPYRVIRELDGHSKSDRSIREPARIANRILDDLREKKLIYPNPKSALESTISSFDNGGKVAWYAPSNDDLKIYNNVHLGDEIEGDDLVLMSALKIRDSFQGIETILITEDINFRLRADIFGINAQKLKLGKLNLHNPDELYCGYSEFFVNSNILENFCSSGQGLEKYINLSDLVGSIDIDGSRLISNQGVKLTDKNNNKIYTITTFNPKKQRLESLKHAVYFDNKKIYEHLLMKIQPKCIFGITPRDERQLLYMEYLLNPEINLVAVNGRFGTGKTRLLMAASLYNLFSNDVDTDFEDIINKRYSNGIIILRPEYLAGDYNPGYLPGSLEEKIEPFLKPYYQSLDALAKLNNKKNLIKNLEKNNLLKWEATSFLRGQDISDSLVCMDETQNGTSQLAVLFLSRISTGSKTVILGDLSQIDNTYVDYNNNALALITEAIRRKRSPEYAAITLKVNYRGGVSKLTETLFEMLYNS